MSDGGEIFALDGEVTSEPSFDLALRGYHKGQVHRYVSRAEAEISSLATERELAYTQIHTLAGQVKQLQYDLATVRSQLGVVDKVSFRHLGPAVERILAMAEEQADEIRNTAADEAEDAAGAGVGREESELVESAGNYYEAEAAGMPSESQAQLAK